MSLKTIMFAFGLCLKACVCLPKHSTVSKFVNKVGISIRWHYRFGQCWSNIVGLSDVAVGQVKLSEINENCCHSLDKNNRS